MVDDGSSDETPAVVARARACARSATSARRGRTRRATRAPAPRQSDLIALVDDDVEAPPGWLRALVEGAARHPEADAFGGPIRARLEGPAPRSCGRELPPITTLDLGPRRRARPSSCGARTWLFRRSAFERVGPFDERLPTGGDEEDWLRRLTAEGGKVVYLAAAGLDHRRAGDDVRLRSLMRSAYHRGRNLRAYDAAPRRRARPRPRAARARRLRLAHRAPRLPAGARDGRALGGPRARGGAAAVNWAPDPDELPVGRDRTRGRRAPHGRRERSATPRSTLARGSAAPIASSTSWPRRGPARDVLVLSVYRPATDCLPGAVEELLRSRHRRALALGSTGAPAPALAAHTLASNLERRQVREPERAARAGRRPRLRLARWWSTTTWCCRAASSTASSRSASASTSPWPSPRRRLMSHAAWRVTRRRGGSLVRETRFVEIGPVTASGADAAAELLPFPDLRCGWGLDLALGARWRRSAAGSSAWWTRCRCATSRAGGRAYSRRGRDRGGAAQFLADRPFVPSAEAQETLVTHRTLRREGGRGGGVLPAPAGPGAGRVGAPPGAGRARRRRRRDACSRSSARCRRARRCAGPARLGRALRRRAPRSRGTTSSTGWRSSTCAFSLRRASAATRAGTAGRARPLGKALARLHARRPFDLVHAHYALPAGAAALAFTERGAAAARDVGARRRRARAARVDARGSGARRRRCWPARATCCATAAGRSSAAPS